MELSDALQIINSLADGRNPLTGQPLGADHLCQQPQVIRALCIVVQQLRAAERRERPTRMDLVNAGKPWTQEEEAELVRAFEAGTRISQLSRKHGRTRQAIQGRLYLLGKVPDWRMRARPSEEPEVTGSQRSFRHEEVQP